jgi:hypothetical protein
MSIAATLPRSATPARRDPRWGIAVRIYVVAALLAVVGARVGGYSQDINYAIARLMLHSTPTHVSGYSQDI